jgi:alginate biosynthesis protein AlgX
MKHNKLLTASLIGSSIAVFSGLNTGFKPVLAASHSAASDSYTVCDAAQKLSSVPMKGLNDWLFIDSEFASNRFAWEGQYAPVQRFSQALEAQGIKLITIPIPNRPALYSENIDTKNAFQAKYKPEVARANYSDSVERFRKLGISTINLQEAFLQHNKDSEPMFFARDHHWTPAGARLAAQLVKTEMQTSAQFKSLPKVQYETRSTGTYDFHGNIGDKLEEACPNIKVPTQATPKYITERQGSGGLLGDEQIDVALLGSSYSAPPWSPKELDYNFAGFLQDSLQTNVVNAAISGGAYDASTEAYFLSKAYREHKPKFVLFEFWYFPYGQPLDAFRRVIPSIYGACDASRTVIAESTKTLETNTPSVIVNTQASKGITGASKYLYFQLSDPNVTTFEVRFEYDNGQSETMPVDRNSLVKNDGRYFLDLNDALTGNLLKATLLTKTNTKGTVTTRVCQAPAAIR